MSFCNSVIVLSVAVVVTFISNWAQGAQTDCQSAREYITTYEFLKTQKELGFNIDVSRDIAEEVSKGCTGAAQRFISVFNLLQKFEVGTKDALKTAKLFAQKTDAHADTFQYVLEAAYLKEYLDMDLSNSVKLARDLSDQYAGEPKNAKMDFQELVRFCKDTKDVNLSPAMCGVFAGRVAKHGEKFTKLIAPAYIKTYEFLRSEKTINANVADGLKWAEEIISHSPDAVDNFVLAYKYGIRDDGMALPARASLQFARAIAARTVDGKSERLPANLPKNDKPTPSRE